AVRHAHDVKTAESWLLVSILMRSEGRNYEADRMWERAKQVRLDEINAQPEPGAEPAPEAPRPATSG
ncbi:MAG: hypothetical protein VYC34_06090, partial [Planctomycetota bacterium]|nr:hypothetical protein [Planctomycetota bacterium]